MGPVDEKLNGNSSGEDEGADNSESVKAGVAYTWVPVVLKRLAYIEARLEGMESQLERMEKANAELRYLLSQLPPPRSVPRQAWQRVWDYMAQRGEDSIS
jgi:hypothetical protein